MLGGMRNVLTVGVGHVWWCLFLFFVDDVPQDLVGREVVARWNFIGQPGRFVDLDYFIWDEHVYSGTSLFAGGRVFSSFDRYRTAGVPPALSLLGRLFVFFVGGHWFVYHVVEIFVSMCYLVPVDTVDAFAGGVGVLDGVSSLRVLGFNGRWVSG